MEKFDISVSGTDELFNFQVVNRGTASCEYDVKIASRIKRIICTRD